MLAQVVVAATNFLLAWYSWCRWRMGIFYAVLNLNLVVFCQYRLHPDHTGSHLTLHTLHASCQRAAIDSP